MRYLIITLSLLLSSTLYSQSEDIFETTNGVVVIKNDLAKDRMMGYMGTRSDKARKYYNKAYRKSVTDVYKAISLYLKIN